MPTTDQADALETYYGPLPCPVIVRDVETGLITYANAAAAELAGFAEAGEMVGKTTFHLWPGRAEEWREADRKALSESKHTRSVERGDKHIFRLHRQRLNSATAIVCLLDLTPVVDRETLVTTMQAALASVGH